MSTAAQVAKQAQHLGKQLQAVLDVAIYLEELGDLEQAIEDAKRWIASAHDLRAEAEQDLTLAQNELELMKSRVEAEKTEARRSKAEAQARSAQLIAQARKTVDEGVKSANEEANRVMAALVAETKTLEEKRATVAGSIAGLETKYAILERGFQDLREKTRGVDDDG